MQLPFWKIAVLAVIQGVTEFLPISSDGHLLVAAAFMSPDGTVKGMELNDLTIVLHIGTLLSILVFYRKKIWELITSDRRTIWLIVLGTIPAVLVGLPLKLFGKKNVLPNWTLNDLVLENITLSGLMLVATGLLLVWASRKLPGPRQYQQLSLWQTLVIGIAQAAAILPGLSRSGMTISTALRQEMAPKSAATFSFLLAIPAIGGAGFLEVLMMLLKKEATVTPISQLVAGALISFVVGIGSLAILVRVLERGRLQWFAAWCVPLGIAVIVWQVFQR